MDRTRCISDLGVPVSGGFQWLGLAGLFMLLGWHSESTAVDFQSEIEPIFQSHCVDCHGVDEQNSRFRVDRLSSLLSGGDSGEPAIVPGDSAASHLLKLIKREEPGWEMPPDEALSSDQIQLIEQWIMDGAKTPARYGGAKEQVVLDHWSFQPVRRPEAANLDELIQARLMQKGLEPSGVADRPVLIRRLYLVMLGLPPTPAAVKQFVNDQSEDAWTKLVEQVLASPHYGERWASHWLDLVRFGETDGFETNRERPHAWHFRDWVIESFNQDKPYDQFVREQLAGDAIGAEIGTSFLVAGPRDIVKGQDALLQQVQRMNELDDMINTTGTAFLGLTTGCARCHNHKFDPISQRDYYALQAVFAGVTHGDRSLPMSTAKKQQLSELEQTILSLKNKLQPYIRKESVASIVVDESMASFPVPAAGEALKAEATESSLGGKHYTWWKLRSGQDHVVYQPRVRGRYRIWLSWGAGHATHCTDARYVIRSATGDREIARVNQQLAAGGTGSVDQVSRWSGFLNAGIHLLQPEDQIVLVGGETNSAITADVIAFQPVSDAQTAQATPESTSPEIASSVPAGGQALDEEMRLPPFAREAVSSMRNVELLVPREAKYVRFHIESTTSSQACIDELEIYAGNENVALANAGAVATSSGDFKHPLHRLEQINDGKYGNPRSWIVASNEGGWVQIELAEPAIIDRVVWGRDREGRFRDRTAIAYRIESALQPGEWEVLATNADRRPQGAMPSEENRYAITHLPEQELQQVQQWIAELQSAGAEKTELEKPAMIYAGKFSQPPPTHRLFRGEPNAKRERVGPDAIAAFAALDLGIDAPEQKRRVALADWIASANNPLTYRVIVNRLWQFHFGRGLVDTPSDFGTNGVPPTHPLLLDWLASELIENGFSLKHMHRLILNSKTWRQSNRPRSEALSVDAGTRLWWRFPPRRCDAEVVRDSILAVSNAIDLDQRGGAGFSAFEVHLENVRHYHPKQDFGPEDWRRMVYMTKVRQEKDQVFGVFDCPDASMVVPQRSRSTTPLQALNLLNSRFVIQQSQIFADRLLNESDSVEQRVILAWEYCFSRAPTENELSESLAFIRAQGLVQFTRAMLNANEFLFIP